MKNGAGEGESVKEGWGNKKNWKKLVDDQKTTFFFPKKSNHPNGIPRGLMTCDRTTCPPVVIDPFSR